MFTTVLRLGRRLGVIGCLLILAGCSLFEARPAHAPSEATNYDWSTLRDALASRTHWQLQGKIGLRTPADSASAAINAWRQQGPTYDVQLSSTFLGLGAVRLRGDTEFISLEEAGEAPVYSDEPDTLLAQSLGYPLPIAQLKHWVKGMPAPGDYEVTARDARGLPTHITQFGWTLEFSKHHLVDGLPLPGKVKLTRPDVRIILAIAEWTLL